MAAGKQWGVERTPQTEVPPGYALVRLTDSAKVGGYACHMYLNVPTFTADNRQILFISTRRAADAPQQPGQNLFTCDLESGQITQITDLPDANMHKGWFDPATGWHYFWRRTGWLSRVQVAGGTVEDLIQEPCTPGQTSMIGLTCDSRFVIYATTADRDDQAGPPVYTLYRLELATGKRTKILAAGFRISHVQCSPTDPDFILYNWECMTPGRAGYVPVPQRLWWCNLAGTAGGPFGDQRCNEGRTHEFFSADGRFVGYHGALHDPAGPATDDSVTSFTFGWINAATGRDHRQVVLDRPIGHSQLSSDGQLIVCDKCGQHHLGLVVDDDPPRYQPLYAHASSFVGQNTHPHPQFRPGHRQIVFSTDRALAGGNEGRSDVYLLTLP